MHGWKLARIASADACWRAQLLHLHHVHLLLLVNVCTLLHIPLHELQAKIWLGLWVLKLTGWKMK